MEEQKLTISTANHLNSYMKALVLLLDSTTLKRKPASFAPEKLWELPFDPQGSMHATISREENGESSQTAHPHQLAGKR